MYIIQYNWGNDAEIHAFASTKNWSIQQELYTNPVVGFFTKVAGTLVRVAKWYGYFSLISSTTAIASSSALSSPQHIHHSCSKRTCIITPLTLDRKRVSVNLDSRLDWTDKNRCCQGYNQLPPALFLLASWLLKYHLWFRCQRSRAYIMSFNKVGYCWILVGSETSFEYPWHVSKVSYGGHIPLLGSMFVKL